MLAATTAPPDAARAREAARVIVSEAVAAGELRDVHPVVASSAFFGALNTLCRTYDPDGELTLDEMIDTTLDLLVNGWSSGGRS
ncbi:MAG: hypothetical protein R2697_00900 [Ilumatobacteraceae bacterium]